MPAITAGVPAAGEQKQGELETTPSWTVFSTEMIKEKCKDLIPNANITKGITVLLPVRVKKHTLHVLVCVSSGIHALFVLSRLFNLLLLYKILCVLACWPLQKLLFFPFHCVCEDGC